MLAAIAMFPGSTLVAQKKVKPPTFKNGDVVRISFKGETDEVRWLCGENDEGTVRLVKDKSKTPGTKWRVLIRRDATFFVSLADPKSARYFHGNTVTGLVNVVPEQPIVKGQASGAKWGMEPGEGGAVRFKCLGDIDGARWLKADTEKNVCKLIKKSADSEPTNWQIEVVKGER